MGGGSFFDGAESPWGRETVCQKQYTYVSALEGRPAVWRLQLCFSLGLGAPPIYLSSAVDARQCLDKSVYLERYTY